MLIINKKEFIVTLDKIINNKDIVKEETLLFFNTTSGIVIGKLREAEEKNPLLSSIILTLKDNVDFSTFVEEYIVLSNVSLYTQGLKGVSIKMDEYLLFIDHIVGITLIDESKINF